ncbi:LysR family transcriptional regulator [Embleya scabrispora]|uniref:LysR family transcriptional regulator n=1 Tax=Embleya scabrispora TaxID=159449 RepID=UPI00037E5F8C|nr:LysR family transcriptional regulator [Embleya scabrispora]MYS79212.1 LysR family transcriptional regulator [Streptomyces sp. SID5474]
MTVQVDWLTSFVAVVDHGGFAAAAEAIFRAQSRVSAHVGSLERELGVQLFDRRARPVALTPSGEAYLAYARGTLTQLDLGRNAVAEVNGLIRGQLAVAAHPSAAASFLPRVIRDFRRRFPGIHVELVEEFVHVDEALLTGRVQLGLRPRYPATQDGRLRGVPLWSEPMRVVVPAHHELARVGEPVRTEDLGLYDLVVPGHNLGQTEAYQMLLQHDVTPTVAYLTNIPQTLIALVRNDLGVGFTNSLAVDGCGHDGVCVLPLADPALVREVAAVFETSQEFAVIRSPFWQAILDAPLPAGTVDLRPAPIEAPTQR